MVSAKVLFLLSFFLVSVLGHGWLVLPTPRAYVGDVLDSASQTRPCGDPNATPDYVGVTEVPGNDSVYVMWTNAVGHGGDVKSCRFAISKSDTDSNQFDNNVMANISCEDGQKYNLSVPIVADPGLWYLQYRWQPGDSTIWYGCTRIYVNDPSITLQSANLDTSYSIDVEPYSDNLYYRIALPTVVENKNLLLSLSVSPNSTNYVNATVSLTGVPATYLDGKNIQSDINAERFTIICDVESTTYAYVTLFTSDEMNTTSFSGVVTFSVSLYDAGLTIDITNNIAPKEDSLMYFWTEASTTTTNKRRIIVSGNSATVYLSGPYRSCTAEIIKPRYETKCLPLGTDAQFTGNNKRQYFAVQVDGALNSGFVRVEKGDCQNYSGVSSIIVLTLFMAVVVLF